MPARFARRGENISPPLTFRDIPPDAKSLVLVCHDPDAPKAGGFTHWLMWDIDPATTAITEGNPPIGAKQGTTDWGATRWDGPQPPSGTHRYIFYLYALDDRIDSPPTTTKYELDGVIAPHVIACATLTGRFSA